MPTITCPHCGLRLYMPPEHAGRALACPLCNAALGDVPASSPAKPAAPSAGGSVIDPRLLRYAGFAGSLLLLAGAVTLLVLALLRHPPPPAPK